MIAPNWNDERTRFVLVGIWNTVMGYAIFTAVALTARGRLNPVAILVVAYCISLPHAFATQRWLVFRAKQPWVPQFVRFIGANSVIFIANLAFLPIAVAISQANPLLVQAIFVALSTLASYVTHKHFSFAR